MDGGAVAKEVAGRVSVVGAKAAAFVSSVSAGVCKNHVMRE